LFSLIDVHHQDQKLYLIIEFLDQDLKRYMDKQKMLSPQQVKVGWNCGFLFELI
jgi:hypothetical protein